MKAHPGHPEPSERTAGIVRSALAATGAPDGAFALVHGEAAGRSVVLDPRIEAGAFTGSPRGGQALADLAVSRDRPIPFYAEMGSVNPAFVTPGAAAARAREIAAGYVDSYLLGAGQFCTKPGLLFVPALAAEEIVAAAGDAVRDRAAAPLLTDLIAVGHAAARAGLAGRPGVTTVVGPTADEEPASPSPVLLATDATTMLQNPDGLSGECFGPTSIVVSYEDEKQLRAVLAVFRGELTATVHGEPGEALAAELVTAVARFAGRVVWNGWPTGVAVSHAQHHGGPYPAATGTFTSVGTTAIRRFQRPVALQDVPDDLLPAVLRRDNL